MSSVPSRKPWLGIAGNVVGGLAIIAAVLPFWVLPAIMPPPPIDKAVVDTAEKIKDRVVAKLRGVEYKEAERGFNWYRAFQIVAVSLGVTALILAAASFVMREPRRYASSAAALGVGAVVLQFIPIAIGSAIGVMIVIALLSFFLS